MNKYVFVQRLYASFNENQYPVKAVKENLAKELGLTIRQVSLGPNAAGLC